MNILSKWLLIRRLNRQFYRWNEADLRKHQRQRVASILAYVKNNSAYYRKVLGRMAAPDFSLVPTMSKTEMMAKFDDINTASLRRDELFNFRINQEREGRLDLYQGRFSVGLSSGTSGNKGLTVLSREEMERYSCLLWARSGIPATVKKRRILFALRTNNPAFMKVVMFGIKLVYIDYTKQVEEIVGLINLEQLNILAGPPSLLTMIADHRGAIAHRIDVVISYAEVLSDEVRSKLREAFGAPIAQIYQGSEGFIASTCREGKLHLNEDVVQVELEDAGDAIGNARRVVITDLYRITQPVIRYSLNDILEISDKKCECGSCFRVVERIHGRADDIFHLKGPDGEIRYLFPDYVQRSIIFASDEILEYQAIQHSIDSIEIRLVLKDGANKTLIEKDICHNLQWWAGRAGGDIGEITFSYRPPERNPASQKLIRVVRSF